MEEQVLLSAPLGFSDHQGGHLLGFDFSAAIINAASAARVPSNIQDVSLEKQCVSFDFSEHDLSFS